MNKYSFRRSTAYFLALVMCLLSPLTVLAENGGLPDGGVFVEKADVKAPETDGTDDPADLKNAEADPEEISEEPSENALNENTGVDTAEKTAEIPEDETAPESIDSGLNRMTGATATPSDAVFATSSDWYKGKTDKSKIKFLTFVQNVTASEINGAESWYADADNAGTIICYFYEGSNNEELYVCNMTDGKLYLNADSSDFLRGFSSLEKIYNIDLLNTGNAVNMNSMFRDCAALNELDLSHFDTSKVTTGQNFTYGTKNLETLILGTGWTGKCLLSKPNTENTDGLWFDETTQKAYEPDKIPVKHAATYIARPLFNVLFDMMGHGTQVKTQRVYYGGKISKPQDPVEAGKVFCGWYTDSSFAKVWDFDKNVMSQRYDMTLYAKWQDPDHTLYGSGGWYPSTAVATKSEITKIVIGDYQPDGKEDDSWKADRSRNGGVQCYVKKDILYMTPYTAGHRITLPSGCDHMFEGFSSLVAIEGIDNLDLSGVKSMRSFFAGCGKFTAFDSILSRVSGVTNMAEMFSGCTAMTKVNLSVLDMSACTDISGMFSGCTGLVNVDLSSLDTSLVTDMSSLFADCSALETVVFAKPGGTNRFDSSSVTTMYGMFDSCYSLKNVDISDLRTDKVEYMNYMFRNCRSLESLNFTGLNTEKVKSMSNMFAVCTSLKSLDLSALNTASVTDMSSMLSGDTALTAVNLRGQFSTAGVRNLRYMFNKCTALTALDLTNFDTSGITGEYGKGFTASMDVLSSVTLGTGWNGSVILEAPNENITDGLWYSSGGTPYEPENIPAGVQDTYTSRTVAYTVRFNMMGHGNPEADNYYAAGEQLEVPDRPAAVGYVFEHWCSDAELQKPWDFEKGRMPARDMTLYAKWTTVLYTVKLESNYRDAAQMKSLSCLYNEEYALPKMTVKRTGYVFDSWNTSEEGTRTRYEDGETISNLSKKHNDTVVLYAQWTANTYSVKFDGNGATSGSMASLSKCEYDSYFNLPSNQFRRTGYTFEGWNTQPDGKGIPYTDHASVRNLTAEKNGWITLYAQWTQKTTDSQNDGGSSGGSGSGSSSGGTTGGSGSSGGSGGSSGGSGGSSGGSGGPGGGAGASVPAAARLNLPAWVDTTGSWTNNSAADTWTYKKQDGTQAKNEWVCAYNPYAASGSRAYDWFFFDENGNMRVGWFTDKDGNTYYLNPASDGSRGKMLTGRQLIDGVWYTFSDAEGSGVMGALIR